MMYSSSIATKSYFSKKLYRERKRQIYSYIKHMYVWYWKWECSFNKNSIPVLSNNSSTFDQKYILFLNFCSLFVDTKMLFHAQRKYREKKLSWCKWHLSHSCRMDFVSLFYFFGASSKWQTVKSTFRFVVEHFFCFSITFLFRFYVSLQMNVVYLTIDCIFSQVAIVDDDSAFFLVLPI